MKQYLHIALVLLCLSGIPSAYEFLTNGDFLALASDLFFTGVFGLSAYILKK